MKRDYSVLNWLDETDGMISYEDWCNGKADVEEITLEYVGDDFRYKYTNGDVTIYGKNPYDLSENIKKFYEQKGKENAEKQVECSKDSLAFLISNNESMKKIIKEQKSEIDFLECVIDRSDELLDTAQGIIVEYRKQIEDLGEELDDKNAEIDELDSAIGILTEKLNRYEMDDETFMETYGYDKKYYYSCYGKSMRDMVNE